MRYNVGNTGFICKINEAKILFKKRVLKIYFLDTLFVVRANNELLEIACFAVRMIWKY